MIMLNSNIVAVSPPSTARDLLAAFADIKWVISAYILSFAALLVAAGSLADRFGDRQPTSARFAPPPISTLGVSPG